MGQGGARMNNATFEFMTNLQYKVKSLSARVRAFESGEKYAEMQESYEARLSAKDRQIRRLKAEVTGADRRQAAMRKEWMRIYDDIEKEHAKEIEGKNREIKKLEERALDAERRRDEFRAKLNEKTRELYRAQTELDDEKGRNQKLTAQINRDYENSSISSSLKPNHKKIANNRVSTGKKPGGQPGHEGHGRKRQTPTNRIFIPAPAEYADNPSYRATGNTVTKQMVDIRLEVIVNEYFTPEYVNVRTRQRVHAAFPDGFVNDVNYGGSIKALAFLLNNRCNVSIEKVSELIAELTGDRLDISTGMINGLAKEFSLKTGAWQKKAFADMLLSPVMNLDFTTARVNGKNMNVLVCATAEAALYFAREHKGHEGIKGSPAEAYLHAMVHDHDLTFYSYGRFHQECLEHALRYLRDSMDNEPGRKWNRLMRGLIQEMIHFWNGLDTCGPNPDEAEPEKVAAFEAKYDEILKVAKEEYDYEPPSKYYIEGFKLFRRMCKYRDSHLLFLHDIRVPPTNNLSERLLRVFKRKQKQVMAFRSWGSLEDLCDSLGMIASLCSQGKSLFESVATIFNTPISAYGEA